MTFKPIRGFSSQATTFGGDFLGGLPKRELALELALSQKGLKALAAMKGADITNDNTRSMGKRAGAAAERAGLMSGLGSMFSSVAGGIGNMGSSGGFSYGETPIGAGGGVVDGFGTLGPNYGIPQGGWNPQAASPFSNPVW